MNVREFLGRTGLAELWRIIEEKFQSILVSGKNIKTINGESILGSGNISIPGGGANYQFTGGTKLKKPGYFGVSRPGGILEFVDVGKFKTINGKSIFQDDGGSNITVGGSAKWEDIIGVPDYLSTEPGIITKKKTYVFGNTADIYLTLNNTSKSGVKVKGDDMITVGSQELSNLDGSQSYILSFAIDKEKLKDNTTVSWDKIVDIPDYIQDLIGSPMAKLSSLPDRLLTKFSYLQDNTGMYLVHNYVEYSKTDRKYVEGESRDPWPVNKPLIGCSITGSWNFFKNDGVTEVAPKDMNPTPDGNNPTIEEGYKAQFTGTYKWTHNDNYKDPTAVASWSFWKDKPLPGTGVDSESKTSSILGWDTTITAAITAYKTGLMVKSGTSDVVPASGLDSTGDDRRLYVRGRVFWGYTTSSDPSKVDFSKLSNTLDWGANRRWDGVNPTGLEYVVYAYPKRFGALASITLNGADAIIGSFVRSERTITNAAGLNVPLYLYISGNAGAYNNAKLNFATS